MPALWGFGWHREGLEVLRVVCCSFLMLILAAACGGDGDAATPTPSDSASVKDTPPPDVIGDPPVADSQGDIPPSPDITVTDEEVAFDTADGQRIRGHFYSIPGPKQQAVIFAHELPTDQTAWREFALELAAQGIATLTFDFRGYGESGGSVDIANIDLDLETAVRYTRSREYPLIYIYGASMGGTATMIVAARQELAGIVVVSAPPSISGLDASTAITDVTAAKLFIASRDDAAGAYADAVEAYMRLAPEPKESVLFDGVAHGTQLFEGANSAQFRETLLNFLKR